MSKQVTLEYVRQTDEPRPYIFAKVRRLGKEYEIIAIVDSGADYAIITAELAESLGLPLDRLVKTKMKGIGGEIELCCAEVEFAITNTEIAFTAKTFFGRDYKAGVNLLGRKPLFSLCKVTFDDLHAQISLEGHEKESGSREGEPAIKQ